MKRSVNVKCYTSDFTVAVPPTGLFSSPVLFSPLLLLYSLVSVFVFVASICTRVDVRGASVFESSSS